MITMISFVLLTPIAIAVEGVQLTPAAFQAAGVDPEKILKLVASSALCFHLYQQVSYMILARVTPVSHSIGNCLKVLSLRRHGDTVHYFRCMLSEHRSSLHALPCTICKPFAFVEQENVWKDMDPDPEKRCSKHQRAGPWIPLFPNCVCHFTTTVLHALRRIVCTCLRCACQCSMNVGSMWDCCCRG